MDFTRFSVTRAVKKPMAVEIGEVVDGESTGAAAVTVETGVAGAVDGAECLLDLGETKKRLDFASVPSRRFAILRTLDCKHSKAQSVHHIRRRLVDF